MKVDSKIDKKTNGQQKLISEAVERSAQIEGMSLERAQKNLKVIAELQKHGRAFSL